MREVALEIVRRLQEAGYEAGWVGGCVRDRLLGRDPRDYDIATAATPEVVERLFSRTAAVGRQFGVMLVIEKGHSFQVATFRREAGYRDGRRPDRVEFSSAREDVSRRDFTVNGLYYDPVNDRLWDWVNGEADLRARRIRTIGDPRERFMEDHLRLLRAVRFTAELDFELDEQTRDALVEGAGWICRVAAERVREELSRLFRPPHAARGLTLLQSTRLLDHLLPELQALQGCDQSPDHHPEGSVFNHVVRMLELLPPDATDELVWAVLLHDIGKPETAVSGADRIRFPAHEEVGAVMAGALLERWRFPAQFRDTVVVCVRHHMQFKDVPRMRKSTLSRMLLRPTFPTELELHRLDCLGSHGSLEIHQMLIRAQDELRRTPALAPPLLRGADLLAMGMKPGPAVGRLLAELHERQLQDEIRTREEAVAWARTRLTDQDEGECPGRP